VPYAVGGTAGNDMEILTPGRSRKSRQKIDMIDEASTAPVNPVLPKS